MASGEGLRGRGGAQGDGYAYTVVNRRVNGDVIVRREIGGAQATLRPTDRVIRTARSRMRDFMPQAMVRRKSQ